MTAIDYTAPKTCASFMASAAFGRLIAGPVGSGKTTSCMFELFRRCCEQHLSPDGYRHTRFAIVRQTLKQLKDTVLKDIITWFKEAASYHVSNSTVYINIGDVRSEWILIPLEDKIDQRRLLSMQLTGAWMSEAIEMDIELISAISGRCGRYPSALEGGCTWYGMIADTNMPDENSPWYKHMTDPPPDWQIFIQPSGMSDEAENLEWLLQTGETLKLPLESRRAIGRKYYERLVVGRSGDWIKRYVHAQYGDDPSGAAVYRESFRQKDIHGNPFHVWDNLEPIPNLPLIVGQDFGRDPASVICQLDHRGRLLVLEEVDAEDIGLEQHLDRALRPVLGQRRYLGMPVALIGDPSGKAKSTIYEETTFDIIKRKGWLAFPAPTNDIDPRIRAVESFLLAQRDGGPAFMVDRSRCPKLVKGLAGGYRFAKNNRGIRRPVPDKNEFSHDNDALQYAALAAHGGMTTFINQRLRALPKGQPPKFSAAAWT